MAKYLVKPNFNRIRQQVAFPANNLNHFMAAELHDTFGFYQRNFGMYNWLTLNKELKYVIHTLQGQPLVWQTLKSCGWDDTGSMKIGRQEFTPCKAKINESWCHDELFDSCFKHFLDYRGSGPVRLDSNGIDVVNKLTRVLGENATLGARLTLTVGQLYDTNLVEFNNKVGHDIRTLFRKTAGTCKGWVELVRELGENPKYSHLNVKNCFTVDDFDGSKYLGDPIALMDSLREEAPADLTALMNEGGIVGSIQGDFMPMYLVSVSIFNAIANMYRKQCISVTCVNPRLTAEEFTMNTSRGARKVKVYYIDGIPVIPLSDLNCYDKYLTGTTHFAALTVSGNIGLGGSFGAIPDLENAGRRVGIMVQRKTDLDELGKYLFLAHALFSATIADTDYFVGCQVYAEPETA